MRNITLTVLLSIGLVGAVCAQPAGGITVSTDPAKVAAVERHAAELKSVQSSAPHEVKPMTAHHAMHHSSHTTAQKKMHGSANPKAKTVKHAATMK